MERRIKLMEDNCKQGKLSNLFKYIVLEVGKEKRRFSSGVFII